MMNETKKGERERETNKQAGNEVGGEESRKEIDGEDFS